MSKLEFPKGFLWGTATASYQIEGSPLEDGAGPSIWHRFSHTPGNIANGDTGDVACDHYHRYREDVKIMKELGLKAYRFSIAWPRIFPEGKGRINTKGLDFYKRLVDELLANEITPFITLYHWDLPSALQDIGGWTNPDIAGWFSDYADYLFQELGDKVKHWITLNEPWVTAVIAHVWGVHAPGMKDIYAGFRVVHNELRAHSEAVRAFRAEGIDGKIGITLSNHSQEPASDDPEDVEATEIAHEYVNYPLFLEPIYKGEYPNHLIKVAEEFFPKDYEKDLPYIKEPIDFVGINYYSGGLVRRDPEAPFGIKMEKMGLPMTEMGWEIYPKGLYIILKGLQDTYNPEEVYITENGAAFDDIVEDGKVHDKDRIEYLREHFKMAHKAMEDGVKLKGYFVWSLLDNFEWAHGYSKRFGIVYVDYPTQKRILKDSALWYKEVIASSGLED